MDSLDNCIKVYHFVRSKVLFKPLIVWNIILVLEKLFLSLFVLAKFIILRAEAAVFYIKRLGTWKSGSRNTKACHLEQVKIWKEFCQTSWNSNEIKNPQKRGIFFHRKLFSWNICYNHTCSGKAFLKAVFFFSNYAFSG